MKIAKCAVKTQQNTSFGQGGNTTRIAALGRAELLLMCLAEFWK